MSIRAKNFIEQIHPSMKSEDIKSIDTFGGEFLLHCVDKALSKTNRQLLIDFFLFFRENGDLYIGNSIEYMVDRFLEGRL